MSGIGMNNIEKSEPSALCARIWNLPSSMFSRHTRSFWLVQSKILPSLLSSEHPGFQSARKTGLKWARPESVARKKVKGLERPWPHRYERSWQRQAFPQILMLYNYYPALPIIEMKVFFHHERNWKHLNDFNSFLHLGMQYALIYQFMPIQVRAWCGKSKNTVLARYEEFWE